MKVICGHAFVPNCLGFKGEAVTVHKGCDQGAPESPQLWNISLDEVMAPAIQKWQLEGRGCYLPALAAADGGAQAKDMGRLGSQVYPLGVRRRCDKQPQIYPEGVQRLG